MEFLHMSNLSVSNITNHVAGLRSMYIVHGLPTTPFKDERLPLFLKSLKINAPLSPIVRKIISIDMLIQIVQACDKLRDPVLFKSLYLFSFFSFLRLSNILPHSAATFDVSRHLARGDLIWSQDSCLVLIKWSKTMQQRKEIKSISIPNLGDSCLCPMAALKRMFLAFPASKNQPLFVVWSANKLCPLTDSMARKHLKKISGLLNISPALTFHAFRRSGTTWAFNKGVSMQQIMKHGTWSSDSVWRYIQSVPSASSEVASTFQHHLKL